MREEIITFPDAGKKLDVIKRYLHIVALLQKSEDRCKWNCNTLAELLQTDEEKENTPSSKAVHDYLTNQLLKDLDLDITLTQGEHEIKRGGLYKEDLLEQLIICYFDFIVIDSGRRNFVKTLINNKPEECMWILSRIFFASKKKNIIEFDYTSASMNKRSVKAHPYHLVFRDSNLYLVALRESDGKTCLFVVNRIENLKIDEERKFAEEIPQAKDLFKYSFGSFIGKRKYQFTIRFKKELVSVIRDLFAHLDPEITEVENYHKAIFIASDIMSICKQLFLYSGDIEIVSPSEARNEMIRMLKEALSVYEKN